MDLKKLERFLVVAQTLNYRRAAKQLGITQPPLTRSIRELETSLGVTLLARDRRAVSLTPAGRVMLAQGPRLLAQARLIQAMAARTSTGVHQLRIGFVEPALYRIIPAIMKLFRARWPGLEILLEEIPSARQLEGLSNGTLDVGFLVLGNEKLEGLQFRVIERSRIMLAVAADSPLGKLGQVRLAEAARWPFILQQPEANPATYAAIIAACNAAGFTPRIVQHANQSFTILQFVASGLGIAFVPAMAADLRIQGVKLLPIVDESFDVVATLGVVWSPLSEPKQVRDIVRMAETAGRRNLLADKKRRGAGVSSG